MNRTTNEGFIVRTISILFAGLVVESIVMSWEFWVPPLVVVGTVAMWYMHLTESPALSIREVFYFGFSMLAIFFQGVHENKAFDLALIVSMVMVAFSFFFQIYMLNLLFTEFIMLMVVQLSLVYLKTETVDSHTLFSAILHTLMVGVFYLACVKAVEDGVENMTASKEKDERIEAVDSDMEDFLSNISHELRTPVNVVNGMSEMLIKNNAGDEAYSIKSAGIRLAYQIEDIQDYTECKRDHIILEEEEYISTSLINDVVMSFRMYENEKKLELIVDMDPNVPIKMRGDVKKLHKIFRHLLENSVKFTKKGGIYVRMNTEKTDYGVNLCIEMTDTGEGMDRKSLASVSEGMFQVNKKRNRSSGGIGLGLFIVHGFAHRMGGFVRIESKRGAGTTVRVTIPQVVTDATPCLMLDDEFDGDVLFHVRSDKYKIPRVREFYRMMALNLANGIRVPLYPAETIQEIDRLRGKLNVSTIFMGQEEYEENLEYFDELSNTDVVVAVSAEAGVLPNKGSRVLVMPKPLYAYPVIKVLNEGQDVTDIEGSGRNTRPAFTGVKALVVDDEPMNLVVATGLFYDYEMQIDTADSGKEAIKRFEEGDYDVIFMDHMMPEMDGVEAMKRIRKIAAE